MPKIDNKKILTKKTILFTIIQLKSQNKLRLAALDKK